MTSLSRVTLVKNFWGHITPRRRRQVGLLLVLMLLGSFAEMLSIGAVLPFLGVLTGADRVFTHPAAQPLIHLLGLTEPRQLLFPLSMGFCVLALASGWVRLVLVWANTRLSFAIGADISLSMYRRTLYQPYKVHVVRNSSEIISGIAGKSSNVIYGVVMPTLNLANASIMLIAIFAILLLIEPVVTFLTLGGLGLVYLFIVLLTRSRLQMDGQSIARDMVQVYKALQEGLGGIRDVLIDGSQDVYCDIFSKADLSLRRAQGNSMLIGAAPRLIIEMLGMLLIVALAYSFANRPEGIESAIPMLGALALGALRLMPILQQAYAAWASVQSMFASLQDTLELLDQPIPDYSKQSPVQALSFNYSISLNNLGFRYSSRAPTVLKNINLNILKGSRIGFVGATGGGKSTLIDIVMGLLQPTNGTLEVDGQVVTPLNSRAWQAHIAHVPQTIFLSDGTIEENIAFGIPKNEIDCRRVLSAAQQAHLADIIETWPEQYQTIVGERGVRLSGGQRQRIGIARALYKKADVIIFDEATSALDNKTEQAVMEAIENLNKNITLLIIAHRLTTLKNCSLIVELSDGEIKRTGLYKDIVGQAEEVPA